MTSEIVMGSSSVPPWLQGLATNAEYASAQLRTSFSAVGERFARRHAAVLILLSGTPHAARCGLPDDASVLLVRRSAALRRGPREIAFPGGFAEDGDLSPIATALREANEEVGLDPVGVQPIAVLGGCALVPFPYLVTPVIAYWPVVTPIEAVNPAETAEVLHLPLIRLIDPAHRTAMRWGGLPGSRWAMPVFRLDEIVIWGFTAWVLAAVIRAAGWEEPWTADGSLDIWPGRISVLRQRLSGCL
ncbi:NUDIX hydrolase [Mycobacteroides abscessus]|uniref:NUDIX hydrolase n=1 Tax=Mycobacteroides abscessus TaxID=36809 RepID=UPI0013F5D91C|nr:CoA pyrophosphatase [Mycobacteroides abscessus]